MQSNVACNGCLSFGRCSLCLQHAGETTKLTADDCVIESSISDRINPISVRLFNPISNIKI
jgi:hypothetical protein